MGGGRGNSTLALGETKERQSLQPQPIPPHWLPPFHPPPFVHTSPLDLHYHPARLFSPAPFPPQGQAEARLGVSLDHLLLAPSLPPSLPRTLLRDGKSAVTSGFYSHLSHGRVSGALTRDGALPINPSSLTSQQGHGKLEHQIKVTSSAAGQLAETPLPPHPPSLLPVLLP